MSHDPWCAYAGTSQEVGRVRSTAKISVQQVGSNTYRVNTKQGRSAMTGRFVTKATAAKTPKTTVSRQSKSN